MNDVGTIPSVRVIRMRKVPFIDSTGVHNLTNLCEKCIKKGIHIVLSGVNPKVLEVLTKSGFDNLIGKDNICSHITIALDRAKMLAQELEKK
jgi:SulP family sulfate permease